MSLAIFTLYAFQIQGDPFQCNVLEEARVMMDAVSNGDKGGGGIWGGKTSWDGDATVWKGWKEGEVVGRA